MTAPVRDLGVIGGGVMGLFTAYYYFGYFELASDMQPVRPIAPLP